MGGMIGRIEYTRSPGTTLIALRRGVPAALTKLGQRWHRGTLRKHFTPAGAREYGYQRRTRKYRKAKLKKLGHNRPLVYTGQLMRALTGSYVITTTKRAMRLRMKPPHYFWKYKKSPHFQPIIKAEEVLAVSQAEIDKMAKWLHWELTRRMNSARKRETRVIR